MQNVRAKGYAYGIVASVSYGLNPLFALPLFVSGILVDSVLFYRYAFALLLLAVTMKIKGQSFALKRQDIFPLVQAGLFFFFSSLFLFQSFNYMDAGIASTILFVYPAIVALTMAVCFKEKLGVVKIAAIATAFVGISMLYKGEGGATLNSVGVLYVLMSSLSYALYFVGVNRSSLKEMPGLRLGFYSVLFGTLLYVVRLRGGVDLQVLTEGRQWLCSVCLALFHTLLSLVTIAKSIRYIGAIPTAILGALEPLTALCVGMVVFGERLTLRNIGGILLILFAVTLIVVGPRGWERVKSAWCNHRKID
ncbi:MAG: EamA family transporter [Paraprevotella sp.]|nr:EamA family transporter [Paraprevotella sp.]